MPADRKRRYLPSTKKDMVPRTNARFKPITMGVRAARMSVGGEATPQARLQTIDHRTKKAYSRPAVAALDLNENALV